MSDQNPDWRSFLPLAGDVESELAALEALTPEALGARARALRAEAHGTLITWSPKVFIPLTRLCRDTCGYCTFARPPEPGKRAYLTRDEVLAIARAGRAAGCSEALFTLGDRPEARYRAAREELAELGFESTVTYLAAMAQAVLVETGLLPHVNAGVLEPDEIALLRGVSVSQGLMLEGTAPLLFGKGGPHFGSHTKTPEARIRTLASAGALAVPMTSGLLIGLGESRRDRVEALLVLRALHARYGHLQEVIIQNFLPKPGTRMAQAPAAAFDELLWTAAAARLILGAEANIQAPPNLSFERFPELLAAGINDWGGVSPVTPDHVNPEARWPERERLRQATEAAGLVLAPRLPVYPAFAEAPARWIDPAVRAPLLHLSDASGLARDDAWSPGQARPPVRLPAATGRPPRSLDALLDRAAAGQRLAEAEITTLFSARGAAFDAVLGAADALRAATCGDTVRYVVNRNLNYTNVCSYKCGFCAFSKGRTAEHLRGAAYTLDLDEVTRRVAEAWARGATEVCMQGGIHPRYTGQTYLDLLAAARRGAPDIHIHAFSPLEVSHGAATLGLTTAHFLARLRDAGLGSLPGTAAEILDDSVRAVICPDKLSTAEWLAVVREAHRVGLRTTSTIMFGHVEAPVHWSRHLLALRDLQAETGGLTEFVPLPFVHAEAPIYLKGRARRGPTFRETLLMHAVARLVLHPLVPHIQTSWVKLGPEGVAEALRAGANDLGGTLMNESISRAAGTEHGQEFEPARMEALIRALGRTPAQRTTLYGVPPEPQRLRAFQAAPLEPLRMAAAAPRRALEVPA